MLLILTGSSEEILKIDCNSIDEKNNITKNLQRYKN